MDLYSAATIKYIKNKYGFKLSKSLGQNFLIDKNIIDEIIEASNITEEDLVIEIGPGIGVLTKEAADAAGKVIAVEIDSSLMPVLEETLADCDNVEVINEDILKLDLAGLLEKNSGYRAVRVIGNLPYYITTPIIMGLLEKEVGIDSITVMMQKEVADRICASPGGKNVGAISIAVQFYCEVSQVVSVPRNVFVPPPNVDSAVLRLDVRKEAPVELDNRRLFFECIKKGYGQRRKTLLNSLTGIGGLSKEAVGEVLDSCNIDRKRRAETLTIEEFGELANTIDKLLKNEVKDA